MIENMVSSRTKVHMILKFLKIASHGITEWLKSFWREGAVCQTKILLRSKFDFFNKIQKKIHKLVSMLHQVCNYFIGLKIQAIFSIFEIFFDSALVLQKVLMKVQQGMIRIYLEK